MLVFGNLVWLWEIWDREDCHIGAKEAWFGCIKTDKLNPGSKVESFTNKT
jgi:hypothetical protein